ncbi:hypothetical protein LJC30_02545 [Odoribacter sp. OttesenSCG-928-L07]|nr:hypothetical protein [Odoribacter sp. OttesenSCG-928-L07]MDL2239195.1 hypothetical protein [Bacteroidales bacterium OttesenSCG-928-L14]MDL2240539.1 hypothetical protein [Bacteroidales bacterium OttesenSCG-928-K22]
MEKINKGIIIFTIGFIVVAIVSIFTMIYIVIARGKEMKEFVAGESYSKEILVGMGGNIMDDNNKCLAYYSPTFKAIWDTKTANRYISSLNSTLEKISAKEANGEKININTKQRYQKTLSFNSVDSLTYYMDVNFKNKYNKGQSYRSKINTAYNKKSGYNLISDGNTFEDIDLMKTFPFFKLHEYSGGFKVEENFRVDFLNKSITGRTLGQEKYDDPERKQGLIHAYSDTLMGETKIIDVEKSARQYKPVNIGEDFMPDDGRDVFSTLNYEISEYAYTALMRQMRKSRANRGCVIVMDVATGDIKAMVSLVKNKDNYFHSENVAIKHVYEPGSVFKLASYMVAMNDGLLDWNKKYELGKSDRKKVGPRMIIDSHKPKNAFETPAEIFSESSNIGTCSIIWDLYENNQQKFIDGLRKLHIGEMTGIEVEGEGKAFLKDTKTQIRNKEWWRVSLVQIAYGYEVEITPLQMAAFYNAIANNGVYVKPRLVTGISANKSYKEEKYPIKYVDTICSPEVAAKANEILTMAAHEGTGKSIFKNSSYSFAGKTGTAQYNVGKGKKPTYNASFAGFFPSEKPMYTIYVLISEPQEGGYYASSVAAPVAREIADKIAATDKRFFNEIIINNSTSKVWNRIAEMNNNE